MPTLDRRSLLVGSAAATVALAGAGVARAQDTPGVTATEIRIGSTTSLSGPVSILGVITKCEEAFFRMVNDRGGIAGRTINFIYYDDGFSPPKTVEQTRRLIEDDKVAFLFSMLGTAPNSAVVRYINQRKVPHLFLSVNGDKWGDYKTNPWTMGFAPNARTEAQIYTKYALQQKAGARFGVLYQNDDLGKDFVAGVRDVLGDRFEKTATAVSHEVTDATVESQIISLRGSGADVLISGSTAKFVSQSIRKVHDLNWTPLHFIANGASSVSGTIAPAGPERAVGVVSSIYIKDPADPAWAGDAGLAAYAAFMQKYFRDGNPNDFYNVYAYTVCSVLMKVLEQCGTTLTRENIMRQAANLKDVEVGTLLPGVRVNTSPTDYRPLEQMQLQRWEGQSWRRFGSIIEGSSV